MSLRDSTSLTHKAKRIFYTAKPSTKRILARLSASLSGPVRLSAWGGGPAFDAVGRPPGSPWDGYGGVVPSPSIFPSILCKANFFYPKSVIMASALHCSCDIYRGWTL